jgi:FAD:protein FMN transferase
MHRFAFTGLGTHWEVTIDGEAPPHETEAAVFDFARDFESRFSRFLPTSEVNRFRSAAPGTYAVSQELARLLERAAMLRSLTQGVYDPAVGGLLEAAGYGGRQGMGPLQYGATLPDWSLAGTQLTLSGPVAFDLGGIGKGYAIDRIADIMRSRGCRHILVDGGGDMFGTMKQDGSAWRAAIEYPGKPDLAAGTVELRDAALAVSDSFRRRWGAWHHLFDPRTRRNVEAVIGCAALAPTAWDADCMTSGLFLADPGQYPALARAFRADYLVFRPTGDALVSPDFPGELF